MKKFTMGLATIITVGLFLVPTVMANSFIVNPILNQNQSDNQKSYFYEKAVPGETKEFTIQIKNEEQVENTFKVEVTDAFSNPLAFMEYSNKEQTNYSHFLDKGYRFTNLFESKEQIVKVAPGETKNVLFEGKMSEEVTEGQILGSFQVEKTSGSEQKTTSDQGQARFEVEIKKRFTVGAVMELSESDEPEIIVDDVEAKMDGKLPKVMMELHNLSPHITDNLIVYYKITDTQGNLLFEKQESLFSLAPRTSMFLPLEWQYENFESGDYAIEALFTSEDDSQFEYRYKSGFDISREEVNKYAEQNEDQGFFFPRAVEQIPLIYFNLLVFAIVGMIYYLVRRKRKKKEYTTSLVEKTDENKKDA